MRKLLAVLTTLALILPAAAEIQPPPGTGSGGGGGMATDAGNASLPTAASNLSKWTVQTHQNTQSGECYGTGSGRVLCASDQNMDLIADHSTIQTQDASLISSVTVGGSPVTAGDVLGLDWTVASTLYQIRYTVQAGDTTATIATALAACIDAGNGTHCTVTAGFLNALLAFHDANGFGYQPRANAVGSNVSFDAPWAASGNSVATFLSGGATETLTLGPNNVLDVGPYYSTARNAAGRTPVAGDQIGGYLAQGSSTSSSNIDTQYTGIFSYVLAQDPTNPQGELRLGTSDALNGHGIAPKLLIGNGVVFTDLNDSSAGCSYLGLGVIDVCGQMQFNSAVNPQLEILPQGAAAGTILVDTGPSGTQSYVKFRYQGANKGQIGQFSANLFGIYDIVNSQYGFQINTATGAVTLGEAGQLSLPLAGGVVGPGRIVSGTTDTASAADCGGVLHFTSASAATATLPNNITTLQCTITYIQEGAGQVTFAAASGATIHSFDSFTKTAGQWAVVDLTLNTNAGGASAVYTLSGRGA